MKRFLHGLGAVLDGGNVAFGGGEMKRTVLPPIFLNIGVFLLLWGGGGFFLGRFITGWLSGGTLFTSFLQLVVFVVLAVLLLFPFVILFSAITSVVGAPFYDLMADRLMRDAPQKTNRPVWREIIVSLKNEVIKLVFFVVVQILLFLINLIPGIGNVLYVPLAFLFTVFFLGFSYLDFAFSRTAKDFLDKMDWCFGHLPEVFGLGLAVFFFLLVPFLNVVAIPAAVAGAVRLFREVEKS